ncbi:MAG: hypothetical protein CMI96_05470 [Pelagibacteraceae bacterium]|nr:hypothetical protein [Pelagibacteraceae bacterium]
MIISVFTEDIDDKEIGWVTFKKLQKHNAMNRSLNQERWENDDTPRVGKAAGIAGVTPHISSH